MKKKQKTEKEEKTAPSKSVKSAPESLLVKYDPLQRYLWEIGQHQLLSREEEKELALKVLEHGDTGLLLPI